MARVRTRDTAPEVALRRALFAAGVRGWRLHRPLPGSARTSCSARRVCASSSTARSGTGTPTTTADSPATFWDAKIARNRERDERVNRELAELGWTVLRLWDFEIERDPAACVRQGPGARSPPPKPSDDAR